MHLIIFWAVLFVAFVIIEFETARLISIWFALGAAGALISAAVAPTTDLILLQVVIFLVISGVTLYLTRPLARKYTRGKSAPTNADRVLDMLGVVREEISNIDSKGVVFVGGKLWTARSADETSIPEGAQVDILRIEGNKLIVLPHVAEVAAPEPPSIPADPPVQPPSEPSIIKEEEELG